MWSSARERTGLRFNSGRSAVDESRPRRAACHATGLAAGLLLVLLTVTGCGVASFVRVTINDTIKPEDVAFIVPGTTTFPEVVAKLGAPDELIGLDQGAAAAYHFRDAKYSRLNFGWPLRFWLPVQPDMILAGGGIGTDVFQVVFDDRWVARAYAFARHSGASRFSPWPF